MKDIFHYKAERKISQCISQWLNNIGNLSAEETSYQCADYKDSVTFLLAPTYEETLVATCYRMGY